MKFAATITSEVQLHTVDLIIVACFDFRESVILGLATKSKIRELAISMIGCAHRNIFLRDS